MKIKIKDALWEVTNRCNRNCSFCGSLDIINCGEDTTMQQKCRIAEQLAANAEVVTLTGGEPLMLSIDELQELKGIFIEGTTQQLNLVTNGDFLTEAHYNIFDNVGVSINSSDEAYDFFEKKCQEMPTFMKRTVFITNINKLNFFDLDDIVDMASNCDVSIQFQLTTYKGDNPAKFDGDEITTVWNEIDKLCTKAKVAYILADNLQPQHECRAGLQTCGVLFNGDVVPCLSQRSWGEMDVQGNVLEMSLEEIWQTGFNDCRFCENSACCRHSFDYPDAPNQKIAFVPADDKDEDKVPLELDPITIPEPSPFDRSHPWVPYPGDIMMYGVIDPRDTPFNPNHPDYYTTICQADNQIDAKYKSPNTETE